MKEKQTSMAHLRAISVQKMSQLNSKLCLSQLILTFYQYLHRGWLFYQIKVRIYVSKLNYPLITSLNRAINRKKLQCATITASDTQSGHQFRPDGSIITCALSISPNNENTLICSHTYMKAFTAHAQTSARFI